MKNRIVITGLLLAALLLSGCGLLDNMPKPPQITSPPAQTEAPSAAEIQTPEPALSIPQAETESPEPSDLIHIERTEKTANDPAEGTTRILTYAWDSVRIESTLHPDAAALITEELATLQDVWYTGSGIEADGSIYGYNAMLEAAEDNYTFARESGREFTELSATRFVTVLRADEEVCAFLINTDVNLGNGQTKAVSEALCFDSKTGSRFNLESSVSDEEGLRAAVDTRWPGKAADGTASVILVPLTETPEDSIEIIDRVTVGEGGEACLLIFRGTALDVEICSVTFTDRFKPDAEMFYCGRVSDCALQLALLFPGDLPNTTMLRYRDSEGEHEYLISLSGEDGSILLTENR